jgi:hypothetical protein
MTQQRPTTAPTDFQPGSPTAKKKAFDGLIGRATVDKRDLGLLLRYRPGMHLTDETFANLRSKVGARGARVDIELRGMLKLTGNVKVKVRHEGGTSTGGVHTLYVNGKEIGVVGDGHVKSATYDLPLGRGAHTIRWVLTGNRLGSCLLEFQEPDGAAIPIYNSRRTVSLLRRRPTLSTVDVSTP